MDQKIRKQFFSRSDEKKNLNKAKHRPKHLSNIRLYRTISITILTNYNIIIIIFWYLFCSIGALKCNFASEITDPQSLVIM